MGQVMAEQRIGENYLQALLENYDEGVNLSRTTVRCLLHDLKDARKKLEAAEKKTVASLFDLLDEAGAGSMYLSTSDKQGNIQTLTIVAKGENAQALMDLYRQMDMDEEEAP